MTYPHGNICMQIHYFKPFALRVRIECKWGVEDELNRKMSGVCFKKRKWNKDRDVNL